MKTGFLTTKEALADKNWLLVDAKGQSLGRVATKIATILRGKHKPTYTPHVDSGDFVVVLNASEVVLTGNKLEQKKYYHHSGYIGGVKEKAASELMETEPEELIQKAVKRMLPKGPLGRKQYSKLKVYAGAEHPHSAQNPKAI